MEVGPWAERGLGLLVERGWVGVDRFCGFL